MGLKLKHEFIGGVCQRVQQERAQQVEDTVELERLNTAIPGLASLPEAERSQGVAKLVSFLSDQFISHMMIGMLK